MSDSHTIRLRRAWTAESTSDDSAVWRRKFNCPTGLGDRERVWLVLASVSSLSSIAVSVNGDPLDFDDAERADVGGGFRLAWDVTSRLANHNEVVLEVAGEEAMTAAATLVEEGVAIEISVAP